MAFDNEHNTSESPTFVDEGLYYIIKSTMGKLESKTYFCRLSCAKTLLDVTVSKIALEQECFAEQLLETDD